MVGRAHQLILQYASRIIEKAARGKELCFVEYLFESKCDFGGLGGTWLLDSLPVCGRPRIERVFQSKARQLGAKRWCRKFTEWVIDII